MSRLRRLLLLSLLLLGLAPMAQALDATAAPAPSTDNGSTNDLNKGRATIDPNG